MKATENICTRQDCRYWHRPDYSCNYYSKTGNLKTTQPDYRMLDWGCTLYEGLSPDELEERNKVEILIMRRSF